MPSENHYPAEHPISQTVAIASGETDSTTIQPFKFARIWNVAVKGVICPVTDGTRLTIKVSLDDTNYYILNDESGNEIYITPQSQTEAFRLLANDLAGWPYVRFSSNATETAQRVLTVVYYIV